MKITLRHLGMFQCMFVHVWVIHVCIFACGSWKTSAGSSCPLWFSSFSLPLSFSILLFLSIFEAEFYQPGAYLLTKAAGQWIPVIPLSLLSKYWDYNIAAILHSYGGLNWNYHACTASTSPTHLFLKPLRCVFDGHLRICFSKASPVISSTSSTQSFFLRVTCLQTDPLRTSQVVIVFSFRDWRTSGTFLRKLVIGYQLVSSLPILLSSHYFVALESGLMMEELRGRV